MRFPLSIAGLVVALAACTTAPERTPPPSIERPPAETLGLSAWSALPGWGTANLDGASAALSRSCDVFARRDPDQLISRSAPWTGTPRDWAPLCAEIQTRDDAGRPLRPALESLLVPLEVVDPSGSSRFTGYFEPTYEARRSPIHPYTEPVPAVPDDLVSRNGDVLQRLPDGRLRPYPPRETIVAGGVEPIAWAHPADVFFLQIQGSGRLVFPDGETIRAAYGAHNGQPFVSTANWLLERGWITRREASMTGIKAWMNRASEEQVRMAMNANPRFVFFTSESIDNPEFGPNGALGVPLTPLASIAVDPDFHALGVPFFVSTSAPGLGGDWSGMMVAQDTGGAIKGAVRGDIFFGSGETAGRRAETMNAPGRMWLLLPRKLAGQLVGDRALAMIDDLPIGASAGTASIIRH